MAKEKDKDFKVDMKIKGVELLNGSLQLPSAPDKPITNFNFNINIESKVDSKQKLIFVIVHVKLKMRNKQLSWEHCPLAVFMKLSTLMKLFILKMVIINFLNL